MDPETVVRAFCTAFERQDVDELLGFFAEGAVYHNIPFEPAVGRDAIEATLRMFIADDSEGSFELLNVATNGAVVLTERLDRVTMQGKVAKLPVMGAFEVDDAGKITAWRDYFDVAMLMSQING
jgi:limonene-1,2-epoxide hydrolase